MALNWERIGGGLSVGGPIQFGTGAVLIGEAGAPTDGTSGDGAGYARPGSFYVDTTNGIVYVNTGTTASPSWESLNQQEFVRVYNETAATIEDGDLVFLSGWDETQGLPNVALADADAQGQRAEYVMRSDLLNNAAGLAFRTYRETGGLDLAGAAEGDPLYLSTTPGDATLVDPTDSDPNGISQVVGRVAVVATDVAEYDLRMQDIQIGTNELQNDAVTRVKIVDDAVDETKLDMSVPITLALPFTLDYRGGAQSDGVLIGRLDHQAVDACISEENSVAFTDETTDANNAGADDVTMPDPMNAEDALYVGMTNKFVAIKVKVGTAGASTGDAEAESLWEYSQGSSAWASLEATAELVDDTTAFEAGTSEYIVSFIPPADWAVDTINSQGPYYYIRLRATAADIWDTTQPLLTQIWALEMVVGQGIVCPMAGTISAIDMAAFVASATNDDSEFLLINLSTGLFEQFTWTGADEMDRVTGLSLAVSAGDQLVLMMLVDDGSTEFANGQMVLQLDY